MRGRCPWMMLRAGRLACVARETRAGLAEVGSRCAGGGGGEAATAIRGRRRRSRTRFRRHSRKTQGRDDKVPAIQAASIA